MLHEFLTDNRTELISRCRAKVALRPSPGASDAELEHGISVFLNQLVKTLQTEQTGQTGQTHKISVSSTPSNSEPPVSEIGKTAAKHGRELMLNGFTVDQVVHDYGDLCQAITELASEKKVSLQVDEFRTLNGCLDNAIADAVTEYSHHRTSADKDQGTLEWNERLGQVAHELRNLLHTATLAFTAIKAGNVGVQGLTGGVLDRCLMGMRTLIDRSLAEVRVTAGMPVKGRLISLADIIAEVKLSASLEAQARECTLGVSMVDPDLAVDVDRDLLCSTLGNLLQNAFKFSHPHSQVSLSSYVSGNRILIDVEDSCGGLPPGFASEMFLPFTQGGTDKSGLGLGLSICKRSVEANFGELRVRDIPGSGCVFTIDLPRFSLGVAPPTNAQPT